MKGLLAIGRFSHATRLSVRTLRRYDEQGLLVPTLVDAASGRRYYSPAQGVDAELIRLLRQLDVPLSEVRMLLADREPEAAARLLAHHRGRLADQVSRQQGLLADVDALLADPASLTGYPVHRRTVPATPVLSERITTSLRRLPADFGAVLGRLFGRLGSLQRPPAGPPMSIYHGADFDPEAVDMEVAIPVAGPGGAGLRVLPEVEVAAALHPGRYDRIGGAYRAIAAWAADQDIELGPQPREVYLIGPDRAGPDELRTEVAWPLLTGSGGADA